MFKSIIKKERTLTKRIEDLEELNQQEAKNIVEKIFKVKAVYAKCLPLNMLDNTRVICAKNGIAIFYKRFFDKKRKEFICFSIN